MGMLFSSRLVKTPLGSQTCTIVLQLIKKQLPASICCKKRKHCKSTQISPGKRNAIGISAVLGHGQSWSLLYRFVTVLLIHVQRPNNAIVRKVHPKLHRKIRVATNKKRTVCFSLLAVSGSWFVEQANPTNLFLHVLRNCFRLLRCNVGCE